MKLHIDRDAENGNREVVCVECGIWVGFVLYAVIFGRSQPNCRLCVMQVHMYYLVG